MKNEIVFDVDNNCYIEITRRNGDVILAQIDGADIELVEQYRWYASTCGYIVTSTRINGADKQSKLRLHRHLLGYHGPLDVDHFDRCKSNNTRANIRIVTEQENTYNRSNIKGYRKVGNRFEARIGRDYKLKSLGAFDTRGRGNSSISCSKNH